MGHLSHLLRSVAPAHPHTRGAKNELQRASNDPTAITPPPATPITELPPPAAPLTPRERAAITAWMHSIEETDPEEIGRELAKCERDAAALRWFLDKAAELPPVNESPAPPPAFKAAPFEGVAGQIERVLSGLALLTDDRRYIEQYIKGRGLYGRARESLLTEYRQQWEQAAADEPSDIRRDNVGRKAANQWLKENA